MTDGADEFYLDPKGPGGTEVTIGGHKLTIAPLNLRALKTYAKTIDEMIDRFGASGGRAKASDVLAVVPIVLASLRRNHPNLTEAFLDDSLDLATVQSLLITTLVASTGGPAKGEATAPVGGGPTSTGAA